MIHSRAGRDSPGPGEDIEEGGPAEDDTDPGEEERQRRTSCNKARTWDYRWWL